MDSLLTAAQMRAIEQAAISTGRVTGLDLMERAGRGVVAAIFDAWPDLAAGPHRAVILCGPGNNGGDGFVIARLLAEWGWQVDLYLYGAAARLPQDARVNHDRWCRLGAVRPAQAVDARTAMGADVVVDALFGTGLRRPLEAALCEVLGKLSQGPDHMRRVAVDIPSGVDADSGRVLGEDGQKGGLAAFRADLTVSFERPKIGHYLLDRTVGGGRLVICPIGVDPRAAEGPATPRLSRPSAGALVKSPGAHKYDHGHALVLSGPSGKGGAARLAARGALRIGAGLVTLGVPHAALVENASQLTAVMLAEIGDAAALCRVLEEDRISALCLGPGLGAARVRELVPVALADGRACVLDADGLSIWDQEEDMRAMLHPGCVLTPHMGEFRRLFPDIAARLAAPAETGPAYSRLDAARDAAARAGCTVLLKGADTVIAAPDGACVINTARYDREAPWLATAGAGDVLAGFIAGLLARGVAPMEAAQTAAWLHVEAARLVGPGLIAEDLPETLPAVFHELGL